jgi:hypothetical protein
MYAVTTFLIVAVVTIAFTKLATGALIATGVPPESAAFQARSAFSGAGFTTTEAENVVNHPARRRIIATTMFVGSLGTPTLIVTVLVGLIAPGPGSTTDRTLVTVSGLFLIFLAVFNKPATRWLQGIGDRYVQRHLLPVLSSEREELLVLSDDFAVQAITVVEHDDDSPRSLRSIARAVPGATVLGIRRGNEFLGEPPVDVDLELGDELIVSARRSADLTAS